MSAKETKDEKLGALNDKKNWFPYLILIRKAFNCLSSTFSRIETDALDFKDEIETILSLQSLNNLILKVPSSLENIRSLFEFLLLDSFKKLHCAATKANVENDKPEILAPL